MEPKVHWSVITNLEYQKTTNEGIILTGLVTDIWVRSPFIVSLESIRESDLSKDKLLGLHNNHKLCFVFESMKLD
jgi:hypothetical protein